MQDEYTIFLGAAIPLNYKDGPFYQQATSVSRTAGEVRYHAQYNNGDWIEHGFCKVVADDISGTVDQIVEQFREKLIAAIERAKADHQKFQESQGGKHEST